MMWGWTIVKGEFGKCVHFFRLYEMKCNFLDFTLHRHRHSLIAEFWISYFTYTNKMLNRSHNDMNIDLCEHSTGFKRLKNRISSCAADLDVMIYKNTMWNSECSPPYDVIPWWCFAQFHIICIHSILRWPLSINCTLHLIL